jgi:hypothetical protein
MTLVLATGNYCGLPLLNVTLNANPVGSRSALLTSVFAKNWIRW